MRRKMDELLELVVLLLAFESALLLRLRSPPELRLYSLLNTMVVISELLFGVVQKKVGESYEVGCKIFWEVKGAGAYLRLDGNC